ncbi:MAG: hypothetical protein U1E43_00300 [Rhodospirillales bacterium]
MINSFSNRPCVVIRDYLQPFAQSETGPNIVFKDMNYYVLPWPREQLRAIVETGGKTQGDALILIETGNHRSARQNEAQLRLPTPTV